MSAKLIYDNIAGEKTNEINDNFQELLQKALGVSKFSGRHRNAKFAKMLNHYAKEKSMDNFDLGFSGKDIKRLLKPKKKRVYTKHSLEIVYYMVQYLLDNGFTRHNFLTSNAEYIREIYNRVNLMQNILEEEEDVPSLIWQEDRIRYFVLGIPQYINI